MNRPRAPYPAVFRVRFLHLQIGKPRPFNTFHNHLNYKLNYHWQPVPLALYSSCCSPWRRKERVPLSAASLSPRSTTFSISPATTPLRPVHFRHVTKNPSPQVLWNPHLQTVTPVSPLESAFTKNAGCHSLFLPLFSLFAPEWFTTLLQSERSTFSLRTAGHLTFFQHSNARTC